MINEDIFLTSAFYAVPFPDCLGLLLRDVNAVAVEPFIALIATTVRGRGKNKNKSGLYITVSIYKNILLESRAEVL